MKILFTLLISFICLILVAQTNYGQTVTIGTQVWMSKNLDLDKFRNGDSIPQAKTYEDWKFYQNYSMPTWCYYNFDSINEKHNGKLYNWYAVNDERGLAPKGYHVPAIAEWKVLTEFMAGEKVTKKNLTITNNTWFSSLPGGHLDGEGFFSNIKYRYLWSSSVTNLCQAIVFGLDYEIEETFTYNTDKGDYLFVRCIKD